MSTRLLAGASSRFAHFAGIGRARADDSDDRREDDDTPAGKKKGKGAEDDSDDRKPDDEDDDQGARADDAPDNGDDLDDDQRQGKKKGKGADDGDDSDGADADDDQDEMTGKSANAEARRRERARCAAIFAEPKAAENPELAASLAFETTLPRSQAIALLRKQKTAPRASAGRRNPDLGAGAGTSSASPDQAIAARWDRHFANARPDPRGTKR